MSGKNVIIIGAGPAGLGAAYELASNGIPPIVVEQAGAVGGISRTETYKDFRLDIGGHRFFSKIERINQLWHAMLGDDFLTVSRQSRIYYGNKLFDYPLRPSNALANLGFLEGMFIVASFVKSQIWPYPKEISFKHWVSNRFGHRLYETFFKTYTEKVWGISCDDIAADWAAQRIKGLSLVAALSNALLGTRNAKTLIKAFNYPRLGPGMMWARFEQAVRHKGGDVRLNCRVDKITWNEHAIDSVSCSKNGHTLTFPVDQLVSSMPISTFVTLLHPKAPDAVLHASRQLAYRAFIIVMLIVKKETLFSDQWIYVHSPEVQVGRIQNFKNWSPAMVPDPRFSSVGMEYFCNAGDHLWKMPDRDLQMMATQELSRLGFAEEDDVVDGHVIRQPGAYPIYNQDYKGHLAVIQAFLARFENLQTVGRNGMHRYNNMDHSMLTGMLAAENIMGANHNLWEINEEGEYLEQEKGGGVVDVMREQFLAQTFARIDQFALAVAVGSVSGLLAFVATLWLVIKGGEVVGPNLQLLSQFFVGYTVTVMGAFIAFGYSFFWGFLFGWLFGYLRNLLLGLFVFWAKKKAELLSIKDFFDHL